jgi:hypothetical protein
MDPGDKRREDTEQSVNGSTSIESSYSPSSSESPDTEEIWRAM